MAQNGSEGPLLAGVAGRYALALYELAHDQGQVDDVAKNLDAFDALYREPLRASRDLDAVLGSDDDDLFGDDGDDDFDVPSFLK